MSRAFRSSTLKSLALVTLPEEKQIVRPVYTCRHWRPRFKGLHLDEPWQVSLPNWKGLISPNFQHWASLGVRRPQGGDRETHQERLLEKTNGRDRRDMVLPAPKGCRVQHCAFLGGRLTWNQKHYREKSIKKSSLFGRSAIISFSPKLLSPVPDIHLPLKLLFIMHFASRVCSTMREIWPRACRERGLQMAGGMALGYSEEVAHIWLFNLNKTNFFFFNVKIYIKAKLDMQTRD